MTLLTRHSAGDDGRVGVLGLRLQPTSLPAVFTTTFSLLSMLVCPIVGAVADCSPHRRRLLYWTTLGAAVSLCIAIFVQMQTWWLGGVVVIATLLLSTASDLLMNSYLPEIAGRRDANLTMPVSTDDRPRCRRRIRAQSRVGTSDPAGVRQSGRPRRRRLPSVAVVGRAAVTPGESARRS